MISLFRYIFPGEIKIGSLWKHEDDFKNPFSTISYKVVENKYGFIKYQVIGKHGFLSEASAAVRSFYAFYREVKETK